MFLAEFAIRPRHVLCTGGEKEGREAGGGNEEGRKRRKGRGRRIGKVVWRMKTRAIRTKDECLSGASKEIVGGEEVKRGEKCIGKGIRKISQELKLNWKEKVDEE